MDAKEVIQAELDRVARELREWSEHGEGAPPHSDGYLEGLRFALDAHGAEYEGPEHSRPSG